jgi:hypothetical protein
MSKRVPASLIFAVILESDSEGLRFPDGWLCATTTPEAETKTAFLNNILTSVTVPDIIPFESCFV